VDEHLKNELKAETEMAIAANAYKKMDIDLNTKINAEHATLDS
jgi:hypothetical protein